MLELRSALPLSLIFCALLGSSALSSALDAGEITQAGDLPLFSGPETITTSLNGFDTEGGTLQLTAVRFVATTFATGGFTTTGTGGTATYFSEASVEYSLGGPPFSVTQTTLSGTVDNSGPPLSALLYNGMPEEFVLTDAAALAAWVSTGTITLVANADFSTSLTPPGLIQYSAIGGSGFTVTYEFEPATVGTFFLRGDVNADGSFDIADPITLLGTLFMGPTVPVCRSAADANDDGGVNIADAVYALNTLFIAGDPPPAPFGVCGEDPTPDGLDCLSFPPCP